MRLISALKSLFTRTSSHGMNDLDWSDYLPTKSATGINVTPDNATRSSAVFGCVRILAETVAVLPFLMYKRKGEERTREMKHPLYKLLHDSPNRWQTSFEFREMMMGHVLLRGNGYAQKVYDGSGNLIELVPLNPCRTEPVMDDRGDVYYIHRPSKGGQIVIPSSDMFHLKGYSPDGLVGTSPIAHAAETVGLAIAAEEFGARTFSNDAQPGGVLEHPGQLGEEALKNLRDSIEKQHTGVQNARKWMILEEGMKWTRIGMSPDDTQFIESRKFQIEEIARIFRVPPHLLGHLENATFSNIEHQGLNFVIHTILPWLKRWEQAIHQRLLTEQERERYYCEFLVEGLLRGDLPSRYQGYSVGRQWGWLSVNDVRRKENLDPVEGGDTYLVPMNMVDAKRLDEVIDSQIQGKKDTKDPLDPSSTPPAQALNNQSDRGITALEAFKPVLRDTLTRFVERVAKSKKPISDHEPVIREGLKPIIAGLFMLNNNRNPDTQTDIVLRTFFSRWITTGGATDADSVDERMDDVISLIESVNNIRVIEPFVDRTGIATP